MPVVVAVDIGSTSARAGVFDAGGIRLARAEHGFSVARPLPDHAEHQSEEIWRAVCAPRAGLRWRKQLWRRQVSRPGI